MRSSDPPELPVYRIGSESHSEKLLILAESFYLESRGKEIDPDTWYARGMEMLNNEERTYLSLPEIFRKNWISSCHWKNRGCAIFRSLERALVESGMRTIDNMLDHVTLGNCFRRPAYRGGSLSVLPEDVRHAQTYLTSWVESHDVAQVICVSSKAYDLAVKHIDLGRPVFRTTHPACPWWNRDKGKYGRKKFADAVAHFREARHAPGAFVADG